MVLLVMRSCLASSMIIAPKEQPLSFDSGDSFQGLPISNSSKGEDMATVMNAVGYDAMTVGNHEFDFGLDQLRRLSKQINFSQSSHLTSMSMVFVFSNHLQSLIKHLVLMVMKSLLSVSLPLKQPPKHTLETLLV